MKNLTLTLAPVFALALGSVAFAEAHIDTDGDGAYSMEELMVVYPDITAETFTAIDTDANGSVSPEELTAAVEAGTVPAAG